MKNATEIICVVDKSGSMEAVASDAIGGFNAFLKDQQALPGEARFLEGPEHTRRSKTARTAFPDSEQCAPCLPRVTSLPCPLRSGLSEASRGNRRRVRLGRECRPSPLWCRRSCRLSPRPEMS